MSFDVGEVIEVLLMTTTSWWVGRARGKEGLFPAGYVILLGETRVKSEAQVELPCQIKEKKPIGNALCRVFRWRVSRK